ncbi:F-box/FBD/LRR-repeat protein At1g13570-like isoform X2 [Helianthus annuus]|uniref:F-box/FBD/LRR-repeat protein At1g13570-like isoform X2 n=1 Tax=Helianthus annuus TaxID=4232 RepID=UPI001652D26F|nr:F-box/FBD/LRR-repeat protein At1g13570-like isoform X2 [Helianthus annuus]
MTKRCKFFYAICQVLLKHQGPIHEFTLSMRANGSCVEIDHILLNLARRNTVKKLKLDLNGEYKLPVSLFSLHRLTDLQLKDCYLACDPSFNGFGSLTVLYPEGLIIDENRLLRLLSSCPLLKRLTLGHGMTILYDVEGSTIVDLFGCVPVIEYLYVVVFGLEDFLPKRLPKKLPTSLVHLKYLCVTVDTLCFTNIYGLPFLALLFRSSPNLETVKLVMWGEEPYVDEDDLGSFTLDDYSDITLEHLKEFEILDFTDSENELDFVRLILAKSPVLKKMTVTPHYFFDKDEESVSEVSEILFCSPCASPVVEIIVGRYKSNYWCPW